MPNNETLITLLHAGSGGIVACLWVITFRKMAHHLANCYPFSDRDSRRELLIGLFTIMVYVSVAMWLSALVIIALIVIGAMAQVFPFYFSTTLLTRFGITLFTIPNTFVLSTVSALMILEHGNPERQRV